MGVSNVCKARIESQLCLSEIKQANFGLNLPEFKSLLFSSVMAMGELLNFSYLGFLFVNKST